MWLLTTLLSLLVPREAIGSKPGLSSPVSAACLPCTINYQLAGFVLYNAQLASITVVCVQSAGTGVLVKALLLVFKL